jgi:PGF-pre-PGF domain-containing protein
MRLKVCVLALLLLSVIAVADDCTGEVIVYNESCSYNDTVDLIVNGDFDTLGEAITLKSLTLKSGSFFAESLTANTIVLEEGEIDVSELGTVLVTGDVTYVGDLKVTDLTVEGSLLGDGELEVGKVLGADLGDPTTIVSKVDSTHIDSVKIPYSADYTGIKFDGQNWSIVNLKDGDYFVLEPADGETLMLANLSTLIENPAVTLTSPLDVIYNKSSVEFVYSVVNSSLLDSCGLYINGSLNVTDTTLVNKFTFTVPDGVQSWGVNCTDIWGNSSFVDGSFTVDNDTEAPGIIFERVPETGYIYVEEELIVNCRAEDDIGLTNMILYDYNDNFCSNTNGEQCSKTFRWTTGGEKKVFCGATDHNGNNVIKEIVIEVREHETSQPSNSNNNDNKEEEKKEEKQTSPTGLVLANSNNTFEFEAEGVVKRVFVKANVSEVVLDVKEVALGDNVEPEGFVYKFVEIEADVDDIEEARIRFSVPKTWLEEQGVAKSGVVLLHYKDGVWEELSTMVVEEGDEIVFESLCYDFSMFAIVGNQGIDFGFAVIVVGLGAIVVSGFIVVTRGLKTQKKKIRKFGPPKGKPGYKFGKGFS